MRALLNILNPIFCEAPRTNQLILPLMPLARPALQLNSPLLPHLYLLLSLLNLLPLTLLPLQLLKIERAVQNALYLVVHAIGLLVEFVNALVIHQLRIRLLLFRKLRLDSRSHFLRVDFEGDWAITWHLLLILVAHSR